jgi:hypothetical protein
MEPEETLDEQSLLVEEASSPEPSALLPFFFALVLLSFLRVLLGYVSVPLQFVKLGTVLSTVVFIGVPIFALYYAGRYRWTSRSALTFVGIGLLIHFGIGYAIGQQMLHNKGFLAAVCVSLGAECGFPMWCVGFGALLASFIKDRNLIVPVSIFLIGFDIFLVLTPLGITQKILKQAPQVFQAVAMPIPQVTAAPTHGPLQVLGGIGPADFLFMGMFFVALFRFKLRSRATVLCLVPAVLLYMLLIIKYPALPMLVPIGLTVLLVNLPEFKMNKEEKLSTIGVLVIVVLVIMGSFFALKIRQAEPSQSGAVQAVQVSAGSPGQAPAGSHP